MQQQPSRAQVESLIRILAAAESLPVQTVINQCAAESAFRQLDSKGQTLKSSANCLGLMQLAIPTAKEMGVNPHKWHENVFGGVKYLSRMYSQFGTIALALAAYNHGPGNISRYLREEKSGGKPWMDRLPKETTDYLGKILGSNWKA